MAVNSAVEFFRSRAVSRKVHFSSKNKHSAEDGFFKTAIFYFTQFQLDGNKRKYLQACNYHYSLKWKIIYPFKISAKAGIQLIQPSLDSCFRRSDGLSDFLRSRQGWKLKSLKIRRWGGISNITLADGVFYEVGGFFQV